MAYKFIFFASKKKAKKSVSQISHYVICEKHKSHKKWLILPHRYPTLTMARRYVKQYHETNYDWMFKIRAVSKKYK